MSAIPGKPTSLADVIQRAVANALRDLHTAIPGKVVKVYYDGDNITHVDVQPVIKFAYLNEDDERVAEAMPVIPGVPISWPGGGGAYITFDIKEGDTGILIFSEQSLDKWLTSGGDTDPEFDHRFSLADAMFVPGLRPLGDRLPNVPKDRMTIGYNSGIRIHITEQEIQIGSDVGAELDDGALASPLKQLLDNWYTFLVGLTLPVSGSTAGPPTTGSVPTVPNFASSAVKLKK